MENTKTSNKITRAIAFVSLFVGVISSAVYFIGRKNAIFSEWISNNVSSKIRLFLADITSFFKFSLAEIIILLLPVVFVLIMISAAKKESARERVKHFVSILSVISILFSLYVYTLGIGYYRVGIRERIGIESSEINDEKLYSTLLVLKEECESLLDEIEFSNGSSIPSLDFDSMCHEVCKGYEILAQDYPSLGIEIFDSVAKPVRASKVMTYLDILGIYTFFTGEANINVHYPSYTTPSTIAHEFAHQRGIAREDEANFIAFLVCIRAADPYVRYSGYINMFEYVASALAKSNRALLNSVYSDMDERMYDEMKNCSEFYYDNQIKILSKISNFFNDKYLKSQGTEGVISYSLVVELCVDYYCNQ